MGGRAFPHLELFRIKCEDIDPTLEYLASGLNLDVSYMKNNLMGSAGKQSDSGDLDIAIDYNTYTFDDFRKLAQRCRDFLGQDRVKAALSAWQVNLAVPIKGNSANGNVQVDFIYGDAAWLKFSHWSPGKDRSPWKGVFISQALGVVAKMNVLWRYPENAVVDKDAGIDERLAEVAYAYDLEKGLRVRCRLWNSKAKSFGEVSADTFETKCPVTPPRVKRLGYVTDPKTVLRLLIAPDVETSDVETFEGLLATLKEKKSAEWWEDFKVRLTESLMRSAAKREMSFEEIQKFLTSFDEK